MALKNVLPLDPVVNIIVNLAAVSAAVNKAIGSFPPGSGGDTRTPPRARGPMTASYASCALPIRTLTVGPGFPPGQPVACDRVADSSPPVRTSTDPRTHEFYSGDESTPSVRGN